MADFMAKAEELRSIADCIEAETPGFLNLESNRVVELLNCITKMLESTEKSRGPYTQNEGAQETDPDQPACEV